MEVSKLLNNLLERKNLNFKETKEVFRKIIDREFTEVQTAALLTALRAKGETSEEIAGAATVMREKSLKVKLPSEIKKELVDTCGTGGDLKGTFNISTTAAIILASLDVPVAKHGNRSVSSKCGSADVLEALGVKIDLTPEKVAECIKRTNFGFMFAPIFHPAMKNVAGVRKELKIRTIFNLLGPLTNPAEAENQLLGVFSKDLTEKLAEVLNLLGVKRAFVVHGLDGMDEITTSTETVITELNRGEIKTYTVRPEDFGIKRTKEKDLKGGKTLEDNKKIVENILKGKESEEKIGIVALNAAFALKLTERVESVKEGVDMVLKAIGKGIPYEKLMEIVEVSNSS